MDEWRRDDIDGQIPDPFLLDQQNTEMLRRLPWLIIEASIPLSCVLPRGTRPSLAPDLDVL